MFLYILNLLFIPLFRLLFSILCSLASWAKFNFQTYISSVIETLNHSHDYVVLFTAFILLFITYLSLSLLFSSFFSGQLLNSDFLLALWTVLPLVILLFLAFPSLYFLAFSEETSSPVLTIKVLDHEWYLEYQCSNPWFSDRFDSYLLYGEAGLYTPLLVGIDNTFFAGRGSLPITAPPFIPYDPINPDFFVAPKAGHLYDCWGTRDIHQNFDFPSVPLLEEPSYKPQGWFSNVFNFFTSLFSPTSSRNVISQDSATQLVRYVYRCLRELGLNQDSFNDLVQLYMQGGRVRLDTSCPNPVRHVTEINGIKHISYHGTNPTSPR